MNSENLAPTYSFADLKNYKIAVLLGGTSNEREVSLQSGEGVYQALAGLGLNVHKIDPKFYDLINLKADGFNLIFNILHGRFGEDGNLQGFFEVMGIKYTGCTTLSSALTLDKKLTKDIWKANAVEIPPQLTYSSQQIANQEYDINEMIAQLGLPLFVKPNREGSSVGVTKAKTATELEQALKLAAEIDNLVIVEGFINGKEYSVPVLNGEPLAPIEIIIDPTKEFYDYDAKYISDKTQYDCPAKLTAEQAQRIQDLAKRAASAVGIKSWCRVDVLADSEGNFYALEVNTNPGMTTHSLFPMAARHAGMSYADLCVRILLNALNEVEAN